jgi:hypothetical protein
MNELNPSKYWTIIKEVMFAKGESILVLNQRQQVREWIAEETWNEINERKITKQKINNADDQMRPTRQNIQKSINV